MFKKNFRRGELLLEESSLETQISNMKAEVSSLISQVEALLRCCSSTFSQRDVEATSLRIAHYLSAISDLNDELQLAEKKMLLLKARIRDIESDSFLPRSVRKKYRKDVLGNINLADVLKERERERESFIRESEIVETLLSSSLHKEIPLVLIESRVRGLCYDGREFVDVQCELLELCNGN